MSDSPDIAPAGKPPLTRLQRALPWLALAVVLFAASSVVDAHVYLFVPIQAAFLLAFGWVPVAVRSAGEQPFALAGWIIAVAAPFAFGVAARDPSARIRRVALMFGLFVAAATTAAVAAAAVGQAAGLLGGEEIVRSRPRSRPTVANRTIGAWSWSADGARYLPDDVVAMRRAEIVRHADAVTLRFIDGPDGRPAGVIGIAPAGGEGYVAFAGGEFAFPAERLAALAADLAAGRTPKPAPEGRP